jgi:monofunctional biosynthetic peptidoglycan transglycosylase
MHLIRRILLLIVAFVILAVIVTTVQVALLRVHNPKTTAWMRIRARQAKAQHKDFVIRQTWVPLSTIPISMQQAVIAAEDENFWTHHGIDWDAIRKAYARNEKSGRVKLGGSTITQQLAKNLYLSPGRSYWRKFREAWITYELEWLLPKTRILELYLNLVEFGPGVFGVEEAAKYHFHLSARQLSPNQVCRLAAILPSPLRYRINGNYVSRRASIIQRIIGSAPNERANLPPLDHPPTEEPDVKKPVVQEPPPDEISDSTLHDTL